MCVYIYVGACKYIYSIFTYIHGEREVLITEKGIVKKNSSSNYILNLV